MIRITINIRPTNNTTVNVVAKDEDKNAKKGFWIKVVTWAGAIAATIACANDAIDILTKIGILG